MFLNIFFYNLLTRVCISLTWLTIIFCIAQWQHQVGTLEWQKNWLFHSIESINFIIEMILSIKMIGKMQQLKHASFHWSMHWFQLNWLSKMLYPTFPLMVLNSFLVFLWVSLVELDILLASPVIIQNVIYHWNAYNCYYQWSLQFIKHVNVKLLCDWFSAVSMHNK